MPQHQRQPMTEPPVIIPQPPHPGPHPLLLHQTLAGQLWLNWPTLLPILQPKSPLSKNAWHIKLKTRATVLATCIERLDPTVFATALAQEGMARYRAWLNGVQLYRQHPVRRTLADAISCGQIGSTHLRDYAPDMTGRPVVLVIPSLVNRYHILDLDAGQSLLRWLVQQGIRPLLVDWGQPEVDEATMSVADYVARLEALLRLALAVTGVPRLHLLGHCLGGNLALGLASLRPDKITSLVLMSTPWNFHAGDSRLGRYAVTAWRDLATHLAESALVPARFVQTLFTLLQPVEILEKYRRLATMPPDDAALRRFTLVEDWLNDGVALTRPVCHDVIEDWYGSNLPHLGGWQLGARPWHPGAVKMPTLLALPEHDHIVPPQSAAALVRHLPHASLLPLPLGHIGMIVGREAMSRWWTPLAQWILQRHNPGIVSVS